MEILRIPHFHELLLVDFGPFPNELPAPFRQSTFDDVEILEFHYCHVLAVFDVDVPRWMLAVDKEHPNDDPVKAADFRHIVASVRCFLRPTLPVTCPRKEATPTVAGQVGGRVSRHRAQ